MLVRLQTIRNLRKANRNLDKQISRCKSDEVLKNLHDLKEKNSALLHQLQAEVSDYLDALKEAKENDLLVFLYSYYFNARKKPRANAEVHAQSKQNYEDGYFLKTIRDNCEKWDKTKKI